MDSILFFDTEVEPKSRKVLDIGAITADGNSFHSNKISDFIAFIKGSEYICGHNIFKHDLNYIQNAVTSAEINPANVIDTLYFSPLLFPSRPYHALLKDDKLQSDDLNNPLNDSIKAKDLFFDEADAFNRLDTNIKTIYFLLLNEFREFHAFFSVLSFRSQSVPVEPIIRSTFRNEICENAGIGKIITEHPVELAYCLSLINARNRYSITPPWVLKNYPDVERIMHLLRNKPCITGCEYCNKALDIHKALTRFFGFNDYRTYAGEKLQENAVKAAVDNQSLLAVFPTGGGKSITFQVPALMAGETVKGLTVVISPLQSLMKDQVDNLEKNGITDAVTINGLLDPIERAKSFERVADGSASMLYISPESLRSKTIEHLLLGRKIVRFVIDEAHCFSSWGQDFRVDYLYIADFILSIQKKKNIEDKIPVSCFTATAKQKVIGDIRRYFREKLSLELTVFTSKASRTNLHYKVFEKGDEEAKYAAVRDLIEEKDCPAIIYVSRTRKAYALAERLTADGFCSKPYHGKMDSKEKSENQDAFIAGSIKVMVATSAFGMGVDKKDVGMVIHYEISDSLENYIQEAGRAGRDESITADCYVLFNEEDLSKHFILLNQTKLNIKEIQQIWKAIQNITHFRAKASQSALEIARKAGWDDNIKEIETRVTTAIAAIEDAGYIKRGQNIPRIFANSILSENAQEAIDKIQNSSRFLSDTQKMNAVRIIKKLFSTKSRKHSNDEEAESRVDYISDHLGIVKEEVIKIINLLREEKILADTKDLTAFIKKGENANRSLSICETFRKIESFLLSQIEEKEITFNLKELNQLFEKQEGVETTVIKLKTIINFWAVKHWIKRQMIDNSNNHVVILCLLPIRVLSAKLERRHLISRFITKYLFEKSKKALNVEDNKESEEVFVEFSVHELRSAYELQDMFSQTKISIEDIEDSLFYLSRIEAIKIEGGFLVVYNKLTIDRLEQNNLVKYKVNDYQKLNQYYENKVQQIHIVGEYAKKMINDYKDALIFVDDYFRLNYSSFLNKYFPGTRQLEIKRNLTPNKYRQLFESLSTTQRDIIDDKDSKYIVVAAGPGSGKTKVLVHKLASLLLMEDVKHEQLLMVTFSRAAATEFKKRLIDLIGNAACFIEIKTFHSYCFDLLGKVGSIEKSAKILKTTIEKIKTGDVELSRITKAVLVIDEAQDMDSDEFALINLLIEKNEEIRIIAVGDDDQNIYSFRGSDSRYLNHFITLEKSKKYELIENFRSKSNLVEFTNQFVASIEQRLKDKPIKAIQTENGKIKIVKYSSSHLIIPLIQDVLSTGISGSTCILTSTNDEAFHITGILIKNSMPAKLIQSNDDFSLFNLFEVRYFLDELKMEGGAYVIQDDIWDNAKRSVINRFKQSSKLEIIINLIKDFEQTNPKKKFKSDLEVFIRESKLEDFFLENGETIFVSTIHKAKGKEFDNVFVMLNNYDISTDDKKRQLYVAMTRAKNNLTIHYNGRYLDNLAVEDLVKTENNNNFQPTDEFALQLNHKDLNLGYFDYVQRRVDPLTSGEKIIVNEEGCLNQKNELILKFSKNFRERLLQIKQSGFHPTSAVINYIVYWKNDETNNEIKIVLPELNFIRNNHQA